ncbi:hypothetical protein [Companilactobacillus pabuli]|jgi:hypothetical protein|uniref:DUF2334 domain-containing protein n=1 Tax=Companilactobacillus pabuli TaxID=2714036 RepID=A0A7L7KU06_9LACO|nr:hypothetical protein [Companilactobacillus pabuli]QMT83283.1 hypothetical protein G6534_00820 [Companilactobacillus pabuli]
MFKKKFSFVFLIVIALLSIIIFPQRVDAATNDNRVLLVYDSQNDVKNDKVNISALQRSLTSMNLRVKTLQQQKYQKGTLNDKKYMGVITMINWRQVGLINQDYLKDRDEFSGIKLHIGENLTQTEINQLGVQVQKIYQQQLILSDKKDRETLPFKESITVITKTGDSSQQIGVLSSQQQNQKKYPFGYINGKQGYLPFFSNQGLSLMIQTKMIAQLFNRSGQYRPLLTITNVSPYTNLATLDKLSLFCYKKEIPFAISMTSVSENTEMKAFDRFTSVLRNVENRGGIIFLQTPTVSSGIDTQGQIINKNFLTYIVSLARKQVFPVGISSEGFWNQDKILRQNSLDFADHWLLLPNGKKVTYVSEDDDAHIAKQTFFGMSASSLNNVKKNGDTLFNVPTALTVSMPYSQKQLEHVESEIEELNLNWYNPIDDGFKSELNTETTSLQYNHGQYIVNGKIEDIHSANSDLDKQFSDGKPTSLFSNFFRVEGNILAIFFVVIMIVLLIFIYIGQKIYWNRFRR